MKGFLWVHREGFENNNDIHCLLIFLRACHFGKTYVVASERREGSVSTENLQRACQSHSKHNEADTYSEVPDNPLTDTLYTDQGR